MLDSEFLNQYINFLKIAKKKFGHQILLDSNFNLIFISDWALTCIKNVNEKDIIGINFIEYFPKPAHIVAQKREMFNKVITTKKPISYIAVNSHHIFRYRKVLICVSPICNPNTENVVALELTGGVTNQNILLSNNEKALFDNNSTLNFLNNYELEIIYFKCKSKTDKEIALILSNYYQINILPKTINYDLHKTIFYKMQVKNLTELGLKAIELGIDKIDMNNILPKDELIIIKS